MTHNIPCSRDSVTLHIWLSDLQRYLSEHARLLTLWGDRECVDTSNMINWNRHWSHKICEKLAELKQEPQ
jgi:hypothetical protein